MPADEIRKPSAIYRLFLIVLSLLAWFALAGQLYINLRYRQHSIGSTVIQYFSYYTILTNILLAWVCTKLFLQNEGLQLIVDNLLHTIVPFLYLVFWIFFVKKNNLRWRNILLWLIYPFLYLVFIFIRGSIAGVYPYPFIDVTQIGYTRAVINSLAVTFVIVLLSLFFVWISRFFKRV